MENIKDIAHFIHWMTPFAKGVKQGDEGFKIVYDILLDNKPVTTKRIMIICAYLEEVYKFTTTKKTKISNQEFKLWISKVRDILVNKKKKVSKKLTTVASTALILNIKNNSEEVDSNESEEEDESEEEIEVEDESEEEMEEDSNESKEELEEDSEEELEEEFEEDLEEKIKDDNTHIVWSGNVIDAIKNNPIPIKPVLERTKNLKLKTVLYDTNLINEKGMNRVFDNIYGGTRSNNIQWNSIWKDNLTTFQFFNDCIKGKYDTAISAINDDSNGLPWDRENIREEFESIFNTTFISQTDRDTQYRKREDLNALMLDIYDYEKFNESNSRGSSAPHTLLTACQWSDAKTCCIANASIPTKNGKNVNIPCLHMHAEWCNKIPYKNKKSSNIDDENKRINANILKCEEETGCEKPHMTIRCFRSSNCIFQKMHKNGGKCPYQHPKKQSC